MKKVFTRMVGIALAAATLSIQCLSPFPAEVFKPTLKLVVAHAAEKTSGDFKYTVSDGKVTITGINLDVAIPDEIDEKPVVAIGDSTFSNCTQLESIDIPSNVESIGAYAFSCISSRRQ